MIKEYICPQCGADLTKTGFISKEMILTHYHWKWKKSKKCFIPNKVSQERIDNESELECLHCRQNITQYVRDLDLI